MIIDILCYVGLGILALFGLGLFAAMVYTVAIVIRDRNNER